MSHITWNRPLPPALKLGGKRRFKDPLQDLSQSWAVVSSGSGSALPDIKSQTPAAPGEIILRAAYSEHSRQKSLSREDPQPCLLDQMAWDWMSFHCRPLPDLPVEVFQWVPDPRVICGIHRIQNNQEQDRVVSFTLSCLDEMGLTGTRFQRETYQGRNILTGSSPDHNLVLSLSGSQSQAAGLTSQLTTSFSLQQNQKTELRWILIRSGSETENRAHLEEVINLDWEGELSHRKILSANQLGIQTGNPAWDYPLAYSQHQARMILEQLRMLSQGHGSNRLPLDAFQIWQLIQALTPLNTSQLEWLLSHLPPADPTQGPDFPIQAELLWQALNAGLDHKAAIILISKVRSHLLNWFSEVQDKDRDGIPENPERDLFQIDRFKIDKRDLIAPCEAASSSESPALAALLKNEIRQLIKSQIRIGEESPTAEFAEQEQILGEYIRASWDAEENRFQTRDFETHTAGAGYSLPESIGNGWNAIPSELPYPSRLAVLVPGSRANHQLTELRVTFQGRDWQERYRIEEVAFRDSYWDENGCWAITNSIFEQLDYCLVSGAGRDQALRITALESDRQDLSQFLPLWAEDLPSEYGSKSVQFNLMDPTRFWSERGLRTLPAGENSPIQLPLNILILQGLLQSGQTQAASTLFKCWLETSSTHLEGTGNLYSAWDPQTGAGLGKGNQLESLLPISLFLKLIKVELHHPGNLILDPGPPVFFPLKLYFKGVEILIEEKETTLNRPGSAPELFSRQTRAELKL